MSPRGRCALAAVLLAAGVCSDRVAVAGDDRGGDDQSVEDDGLLEFIGSWEGDDWLQILDSQDADFSDDRRRDERAQQPEEGGAE